MYLLDTNIVSHWMRGHPEVLRRLRSRAPSELSLSSITLAEILYGIEKSPSRKGERRDRIASILSQLHLHPFDEAAARRYARVRSRLEESGQPISERDTQIAAVALCRRLTVVTHNVREFDRVPGLTVEDWT